MAKQDYYELLGVAKTASADDLKKAYRKLAMQYHPDRNQGDKAAEQKFKEVSEAYEVLKDEQKRAAYDRFGHAAFENGGGRAGGGAGGFDFGSGFADIFEEMFGDFMGGRRGGGQGPGRGSDLRYNLEISLEDAFKGTSTNVRVPTSVACDVCNGTGAESGTQPVTCPTCNGAGKVRAQQGFFTIERTCPACAGAGRVIKDPCRNCGGHGRVRKEKTLQVNIPAGVEDGTRIRLTGEGEAGARGAPPGDLYIFLAIAPHALFIRDGANIQCRVPIPMTTAALGGTVEVPTIDGSRARVSIPPGTQSGHQFRLKGKGMSVLRSTQRGDMYVTALVETPVNLTKRQQELMREFEKAGEEKGGTHPESEGFFAKVKELWADLKE
ncbi:MULTISPECIES: molecular chaperone DnaJ [Nitrospirillum]|uniref:Chaperone protein DnaJ n=2 Tax=Nitrospirillum TaxID=1543705 RepID=A0A248JL59_9PROT|nr:molecular chaperone DnaJ [Nitrospirillum amazonense]ASG19482.1 molecular chaperone DnaJ [Nitrospirillum amazonense CBAmc]MEC4593254.1 molecular chaperone DnaJ [Nitrospirillum amazonense]TWB18880.1 molecular chaperone DnaJ [Nitrospirillum amazonense]TWB42001.1 molecular chaperone DnaJ [Nitrospirillum amazonense]